MPGDIVSLEAGHYRLDPVVSTRGTGSVPVDSSNHPRDNDRVPADTLPNRLRIIIVRGLVLHDRWTTLFEDSILWGVWKYRVLHDNEHSQVRTQSLLWGMPCMWRTFNLDDIEALVAFRTRDVEYIHYNFWVRLQRTNGNEPYLYSTGGDEANAAERAKDCLQAVATATGLPIHGSLDAVPEGA